MNECNGQCCERFFLPLSQEELWAQYQYTILHPDETSHDVEIIAPMVILIEEATDEGQHGWWYTCRHWNKETRLCTIYDKRPQMCRDYPYDSPCTHCGWENKEYQQREVVPPGGIGSPHI